MIWEDALPGMKPGERRTFSEGGHVFRVTATYELGCDTGRRRYRVECLSCFAIVHEATTGPLQNVEFHLRECQR